MALESVDDELKEAKENLKETEELIENVKN